MHVGLSVLVLHLGAWFSFVLLLLLPLLYGLILLLVVVIMH